MSIVATEVVSVVLSGPSVSLTSVGIGLAVPLSVGMPQRMETGLPQLLTVQDRLATAPTDRVALGSEELIRSERGERGRERGGGEGRERERGSSGHTHSCHVHPQHHSPTTCRLAVGEASLTTPSEALQW